MGCNTKELRGNALPGCVADPGLEVCQTGQGKQQVRKSIEVHQEKLRDGFSARQMYHATLRAAAHGSAQMQCCGDAGARRQDKGPKRRQTVLRLVHDLLELTDSSRGERGLLQ